jgi:phage gp16-like protein
MLQASPRWLAQQRQGFHQPKTREESSSFLKKRTKKLLTLGVRFRRLRDSQSKVFCFFSSEKKTFLTLSV